MLERLAADPGYGEAYRSVVVANIVSEEQNVRQVSAKVALGEGDAGIVYLSDVTPDIAEAVIALPIPDTLNTIATYPIAVTNDSANPQLAQMFMEYVLSGSGQDILAKWGFISVRTEELPPTIRVADDGMLHVEGQVLNPLALTADDLRSNFTAQTVDVAYVSGEETITTSFTGVLLRDILSVAQVNFNADTQNDQLSMFIVATGRDGYQAVVAWGEIDPEFGNQPILVAYEERGQPLIEEEGPFRLIVPSDGRDGRFVLRLASLSLLDAPEAEN
jgi:DMSO/TMAO reductase YedYZ molybdopterin-dependent catalytic subunit